MDFQTPENIMFDHFWFMKKEEKKFCSLNILWQILCVYNFVNEGVEVCKIWGGHMS